MAEQHVDKTPTPTVNPQGRTIALVSNSAQSIANFRGPLVLEMIARGHRVLALAPDYTAQSRAMVETLGARAVDISLARTGMNPARDLLDLARLAIQLREIRPDLTFAYFIKPVIYGTLAARVASVPHRYAMIEGAGYVFTQTGPAPLRRRLLRRLVTELYRLGLGQAHRVFMLNPDDRELFVREGMVDTRKICLLDGIGLVLEDFPSSPPAPLPVRFVMVARLLREKGVVEYVEAARRVKRLHPEARFLLLGSVDSNPGAIPEAEVRSWVREGLLEWPGQVPDVRPWIRDSSVFVLPSYREGLPRSTQEAMALGRPVITTDVPGCRQTVEDGVNGLIVPARDAAALTDAMIHLFSHPETLAPMGAASRKMAEERFDARRINARILEELGL